MTSIAGWTSASPSWPTHPSPTPRTSCRSRATCTAAPPTASSPSGARPTPGNSWQPLTDGLPQRTGPPHRAARRVHHRRRRPSGALPGYPHRAGLHVERRRRVVAAHRREHAPRDVGARRSRSADAWRSASRARAAPRARRRSVDGHGRRRRSCHRRCVLDLLAKQHPALERRVRDERGRTRVHVNLFVADDDVRDLDGMATEIPAGADLSIIPAVSGG